MNTNIRIFHFDVSMFLNTVDASACACVSPVHKF